MSDDVFAWNTDELHAALFHEAVHLRESDVLKKALLQMAPGILPNVDGFGGISRQWASICELSADEKAVAEDPARKLHLASALVKVGLIFSARSNCCRAKPR